jgi:hypothetical protein
MIIKKRKHAAFGRVASYHQKLDRGPDVELLYSNLGSTEAKWIGLEFEAIAGRVPRVKRTLAHVAIALHRDDKEKVSSHNFFDIAMRYIQKLGYGNSQAMVWRHHDEPHPHIHLLLNRVTPAGCVVDDSLDYKTHAVFRAEEEDRYGLVRTRFRWSVSDKDELEKVVTTTDVRIEL